MKCKLTRITSTHNNLRTSEIIGETDQIPTVGQIFTMSAPPLESGNQRWVWTTTVSHILVEVGRTIFHTKNSEYQFEILPEEK